MARSVSTAKSITPTTATSFFGRPPASCAARNSRPAATGSTPNSSRPSIPARRDLPRRRDRLAVGPRAGGERPFRRRRPVRLRARDLHRRQQRSTHAANARRRRLLAQRQLVRAHGAPARLRAERPRRERHAHRRLQPAQDGDQQSPVLAVFTVGTDRDRHRPHRRQPARRRCPQLRAVSQGRNPAARAQRQVLHERQVRRRAAAQQGADGDNALVGFGAPMLKAPVATAWSWPARISA